MCWCAVWCAGVLLGVLVCCQVCWWAVRCAVWCAGVLPDIICILSFKREMKNRNVNLVSISKYSTSIITNTV